MPAAPLYEKTGNASPPLHGKPIQGASIAAGIIGRIKSATHDLFARTAIVPGLAVVIVGSDPASEVYVRSKGRKARECGFHSVEHALPVETTTDELLQAVDALNGDPAIHGILVQLPLPRHIDTFRVIQAVRPEKDVDGFHLANVGKLHVGAIDDCLVPCTPAGCMILIGSVLGPDLSGKNAVVIGRSNIVGKPMAELLFHANATVTGLHSKTANPEVLCRQADILVAAAGRPGLVRKDWIKPGAVVIDVGINRVFSGQDDATGRLVGDVEFDECLKVAKAITPVPGGVGPMTISMLMANTVVATFRAAGLDSPIHWNAIE